MKWIWRNGFVEIKDLAKCILAKFDDLVELFWPNLMIWRSGFGEIEDLAKVFWPNLMIWWNYFGQI